MKCFGSNLAHRDAPIYDVRTPQEAALRFFAIYQQMPSTISWKVGAKRSTLAVLGICPLCGVAILEGDAHELILTQAFCKKCAEKKLDRPPEPERQMDLFA